MMKKQLLVLTCVVTVWAGSAEADIWKCKNAQTGRIEYSGTPCPVSTTGSMLNIRPNVVSGAEHHGDVPQGKQSGPQAGHPDRKGGPQGGKPPEGGPGKGDRPGCPPGGGNGSSSGSDGQGKPSCDR